MAEYQKQGWPEQQMGVCGEEEGCVRIRALYKLENNNRTLF